MQKRRKPFNWFRILALVALIGAAAYFERTIVPTIPALGMETPTPTRAPESYLSEADQLFREGKLSLAAESYQAALQANPSDAATYLTLARIQVFLGRNLEAQTNAENALLLNPNNATAHAVRGWALSAQGDFLAGEASITRALELDPNNALAHAYYAELLADQYINGGGPINVIEKMAEESQIALSLGQGTLEAHRARGYVLEVTANYQEAIQQYETAIAINNNIADLHLALGRTYRLLGIYDKAFDSLNRANALNPSDPVPDLIISRVYFEIGEFGKAEQYAEQAVSDAPQIAVYHGNLGVIRYRNFKWNEALQSLNYVVNGGLYNEELVVEPLALQQVGRIPEYYYYYAFTLLRLERCNEAVPVFQQIIASMPPNDPYAVNSPDGLRLCAESLGGSPTTETPQATDSP